MRHASLFSGIGGAEIAASWLGWENIFHVEINPFGQKVLEYWYPKSISYGDITKTDFSEWRGRVDVLTAGFPCQPFSVAGQRKGADDDRSLWPQVVRAVREIRPAWVVGENVAGILTMVQPGEEVEVGSGSALFDESHLYRTEQQYVIETVCQDLEREGYSVQPFVIPACAVGAPHRRDRVWIIARLATDTNGNGGQKKTERQRGEGEKTNVQSESVFNTETTPGTITHSNSDRQRTGTNKQEFISECKGTADNSTYGKERFVANPDEYGHTSCRPCEGTERSGRGHIPQQEEWGNTFQRSDRFPGLSRDATYTQRIRRYESELYDGKSEKTQQEECGEQQFVGTDCPQSKWRNFPTQSPVCGRDDGISLGLAGISFPKWRAEAIKALGNAWVPQVAYEIFRAINEIENGDK